ncbi:MAG TPA: ribbon-helix-helix domain-containing protein [Candidatus Methylomirabilis sp.]|nr:ribbon-helix-helix domain-containing protein [Candidatus Methylomirabilis sp.]
MTRVQVLLTEEQDRRLESVARRMRVSKTQLVREGVDLVLQRVERKGADPLLSLVGQAGRVGRKDVSAQHDAFLAAIERRRNR